MLIGSPAILSHFYAREYFNDFISIKD